MSVRPCSTIVLVVFIVSATILGAGVSLFPKALEWSYRYGLATCCVVAPLLFAFVAFNGALILLTPGSAENIKIDYVAAKPKAAVENPGKTGSSTAPANDKAEGIRPATAAMSLDTAAMDQGVYLESLQYRGGTQYAMASALIYLVSFAIAPLQMITGIIAALAPLLASPFVDALKSVMVSLGGK